MNSRLRAKKYCLTERIRQYFLLERMMGIEPTLPAWEAEVLPMNYIRVYGYSITQSEEKFNRNLRRGIINYSIILAKSSSEMISSPRDCAFVSLLPAFSPAKT